MPDLTKGFKWVIYDVNSRTYMAEEGWTEDIKYAVAFTFLGKLPMLEAGTYELKGVWTVSR
jgi:hypothetical protein